MLQVIRSLIPGRNQALLPPAIAITSCILMAITLSAAPEQNAAAIAQIRSVLRAQQEAWNRGDIDGFMNGYARSASTVFISEDTIRSGWETVRARYKKKYSDRANGHAKIFRFGNHVARRRFRTCARPLEIETDERSTARPLYFNLPQNGRRLANRARPHVGGGAALNR